MKQAKQHKDAHGHQACGKCARTIRIRHDSKNVACTARLQMMPADHVESCEDYREIETEAKTLPNAAPA
jgi:hypothetical protein